LPVLFTGNTCSLTVPVTAAGFFRSFHTKEPFLKPTKVKKFSHKGTIFKTYEGEMILSSIRSNTNVALASEKFLFSVTDKTVALQMEKLQGRMVTVHYNNKNGTLPWRGDTPFIVDSVKLEE